MRRIFAVLDLKCEDISAVAARWGRNGEYIPEGFSMSRSRGIHKGVITDMALAADSISNVLQKLKKKGAGRIRDVYASVSPASVGIVSSSGTLLLSRYGREISRPDVEKCIRVGSIVKLPLGTEALHRIVREFSLDGQNGIRNPARLEGVKLSVDMNILTVDSSVVRNLNKCIALAGFAASGVIFSGIAYAHRTLTEKDKENGVALVNMCKDLTEALVFHKRILTACKVFGPGMDDVFAADNSVKKKEMDRLMTVLRSLEGWPLIREIVITGDAALRDDILGPLEDLSGCPVRFGSCISRPFEDLPADRIGYIGCLGMLDYLHEEEKARRVKRNLFKETSHKVLRFLDKYF
ncbi:MAG: hypothetical protein KAS86_02970 [Candidatus Omnitrophica bacterium]|nr:hypothetical protein [Candidatus Omnitrophota bacterium]